MAVLRRRASSLRQIALRTQLQRHQQARSIVFQVAGFNRRNTDSAPLYREFIFYRLFQTMESNRHVAQDPVYKKCGRALNMAA